MFYLPYNKALKERSRELRNNMTPQEKKIWKEYLQKCGYTINRQKIIDNYIVDFYCAEKKLVIEIDGRQHYTEEGKEYDKKRSKILEGYGLQIIRIKNEEIDKDIKRVIEVIKKTIKKGGQGEISP